jgi:hypothetical protein
MSLYKLTRSTVCVYLYTAAVNHNDRCEKWGVSIMQKCEIKLRLFEVAKMCCGIFVAVVDMAV